MCVCVYISRGVRFFAKVYILFSVVLPPRITLHQSGESVKEYEEKKCRVRQAPEALETQQDHRRNLRKASFGRHMRLHHNGRSLKITKKLDMFTAKTITLLNTRTCGDDLLVCIHTSPCGCPVNIAYNHPRDPKGDNEALGVMIV